MLPSILRGLADLPVTVIAATAGRAIPAELPANARAAAFLPGTEAAARSRLVVCRGGSLTAHQALAAGVPVIGIVGNMDQHLNMICLERAGVGVRLRAEQLTAERLRTTAGHLLYDEDYRKAARRFVQIVQNHNTRRFFAEQDATQWVKPSVLHYSRPDILLEAEVMRKITPAPIIVFLALFSLALVLGIITNSLLLGMLPLGDFRGITLVVGAVISLTSMPSPSTVLFYGEFRSKREILPRVRGLNLVIMFICYSTYCCFIR